MSEYQYIHFMACDRPLDDAALKYMRMQSTRADISQWEFTNEYHFGDFHGNALEMVRRGYDAHLHFANFGIRKLLFRLPELPCDKKTFTAFEFEYGIAWTQDKQGKAGVLSIEPEADAGTYDYLDNIHSLLPRLVPLRDMLMEGDLRPLYLAWLACACKDESTEPPVPAGLGRLNGALEALAELYELSIDLVAAAAQQALPEPEKPDRVAAAKKWIRGLKKADLQQIVADMVTGDSAALRADLLTKIRYSSPAARPLKTKPSRMLKELRCTAESVQQERIERERMKSERTRKTHLQLIAADPEKTIRRIDSLVAERTTRSYHLASDCLTDLAEALGERRGPEHARLIAQGLRQRKGRSNMLVSVLRKRGWID